MLTESQRSLSLSNHTQFLAWNFLRIKSIHELSGERKMKLPIEVYIGTILKIYDEISFSFPPDGWEERLHLLLTLWSAEGAVTKPRKKSRAKATSASKGTWCSFTEWSFSSYVFCNINFCLTSLSSSPFYSIFQCVSRFVILRKSRKIIKNFVKKRENKISVFLYAVAVHKSESYDSIYVCF